MTPTPFRIVALVQSPEAMFQPRLALVHGIEDGKLVYDAGHERDLVAFGEVSGALIGHTATICGATVYGSLGSAREALRRTSARFLAGRQDIELRGTGDSYALPTETPAPRRERIG